jgi:hypothetical protein
MVRASDCQSVFYFSLVYVHLYFLLNKNAANTNVATVLGSIPASSGTMAPDEKVLNKVLLAWRA